LVGIYVLLLLVRPQTEHHLIGEVGQILAYLVTALCCAWVSVNSPTARVGWAWGGIALACMSNAFGEMIFGYLVVLQHQENPFPSLADVFYLLFYPLMVVGISLLPTAPVRGLQRLKVALDAGIIAGSVLSGSWFFLLGPLYFQGAETTLALAISLTYPIADVGILLVLVVLSLRGAARPYRGVHLLLIGAMASYIYADSAYTYLSVQNSYMAGMVLVDTFWVVAGLLTGLAALYQLLRFGRSGPAWGWLRVPTLPLASEAVSPSWMRIVLPNVPVLLLFLLVWLALQPTSDPRLLPLLAALTVVVVLLILLLQVVTLRENAHLLRVQDAWLAWQRHMVQQSEEQRRQTAAYAHELEESIQHLNDVMTSISRGNYTARMRVQEHGPLLPLIVKLNLLLQRVEERATELQQASYLAHHALALADLCRRLREGDAAAWQELQRPSGSQLDQISYVLVQLQRRLQFLEAAHEGS
jgi:hypothetical protein